MDFFERNGVAAVASRLRRLTERLTRDDAELYKSAGLNFKPKWFPVYLTLAEGRARTVAAIAKEIGQTHPSVSVIASEMRKAGLIEKRKNGADGRSSELRLSAKAKRLHPQFQELLGDVEAAALSIARESSVDLLAALREWEKALARKSLLERTNEIRATRLARRIRIEPWKPEWKSDFIRLNELWISQHFILEEADRVQLENPEAAYLIPGGEILFAVDSASNRVAGRCALRRHSNPASWELAKLCVDPERRGRGIGGRLIDAVADLARERGAETLWLESNRILAPAIHLYRKKGFVETELPIREYERVDIQMIKDLRATGAASGRETGEAHEAPVIEIRAFEEDDRDEIIRLVLHCQNDGTRPVATVADQPDLLDIRRHYMECGGCFWVARNGGVLAGTIALAPGRDGIGILKKFFVSEPFRGAPHHLGRRLYATLLEFAKRRGLRALLLDTPKNTGRAHKFYRMAGFRQIEEASLPFRYSHPYRDCDFFLLELAAPEDGAASR